MAMAAEVERAAWPENLLQEHARYLLDTHKAEHRGVRMRWLLDRMPVLIFDRPVCRVCLQRWPCSLATWARQLRGRK